MTVSSDSGDDLKVKALSGFLLIGYTGAASDYVKDCDVDISFKSVNFNWKGLIFWAVLVVVLAAVVLIAVRIIRRTMMTAEEACPQVGAGRTESAADAAWGIVKDRRTGV